MDGAMSDKETFVLKPEHVQLLRRACVTWDDCETGAPAIDPKRPYGNSDVAGDVAEILGRDRRPHQCPTCDCDADDDLMALHRETERALEVILRAGSFEPGTYVCDHTRDWRRKG